MTLVQQKSDSVPQDRSESRARPGKTTCPEGRLSSPTATGPAGRPVIAIEAYAPYYLTAVNTALSRGASKQYLRQFGVGVSEWRVMSWLATEPGIAAARIGEVISMDKGAVSRAVAKLDALKLLDSTATARDPRRRSLALNAEGHALHDRILERALDREKRLIEGVDPDDLEAFFRVMRILRRNVTRL